MSLFPPQGNFRVQVRPVPKPQETTKLTYLILVNTFRSTKRESKFHFNAITVFLKINHSNSKGRKREKILRRAERILRYHLISVLLNVLHSCLRCTL